MPPFYMWQPYRTGDGRVATRIPPTALGRHQGFLDPSIVADAESDGASTAILDRLLPEARPRLDGRGI